MKKSLVILLTWLLGVQFLQAQSSGYLCGDRVQITATPQDGYHFVSWSDGITDNPREIDISSDINLVAHFEPNCGDYANVGIIRLYDWLLMLNKDDLEKQHYYIDENDIRWYRIVGDIDAVDAVNRDDLFMGLGYYLTLNQNLTGTGDYYAIIDASHNQDNNALCDGLMRSEIASYSAPPQAVRERIALNPNFVSRGEPIDISGLEPDETALIHIYDATGKLLKTYTSVGHQTFTMPAVGVSGCYLVRVENGDRETLLRYIVE